MLIQHVSKAEDVFFLLCLSAFWGPTFETVYHFNLSTAKELLVTVPLRTNRWADSTSQIYHPNKSTSQNRHSLTIWKNIIFSQTTGQTTTVFVFCFFGFFSGKKEKYFEWTLKRLINLTKAVVSFQLMPSLKLCSDIRREWLIRNATYRAHVKKKSTWIALSPLKSIN